MLLCFSRHHQSVIKLQGLSRELRFPGMQFAKMYVILNFITDLVIWMVQWLTEMHQLTGKKKNCWDTAVSLEKGEGDGCPLSNCQ